QPFRRPSGPALRRQVPEDDPRDAEERGLGERDHPAVGGEEDQAGGSHPEDEGLEQDRVAPVGAPPGRRPDDHEQERHRGDPPFDLLTTRPRRRVHEPLPNSPRGRNASTSAMRTNVRIDEYWVQQSRPVVGRYDAPKFDTNANRSAPAAAPKIEPMPPTITTTSELSSHWPSCPDEMFDCDAQTTAPRAATAEPTTTAIANVFWMLIPSAEVICSSSTPARITMPVFVLYSQTQSPTPTAMPIPIITSLASEYWTPPMWRSTKRSVQPGQVRSTAFP